MKDDSSGPHVLFSNLNPSTVKTMRKTLFLLAFTAALMASCSSGNVIYLSPDGHEGASGTTSDPLSSLQEAVEKARQMKAQGQEGVTIRLKAGDYIISKPLLLTAEDSGTEDQPFIIEGEGMEKTRIQGAVTLPAFQQDNNGLWSVDLKEVLNMGQDISQLFVDGTRATKARTPNKGKYYMTGSVEETLIDEMPERGATRAGLAAHRFEIPQEAVPALEKVNAKALGRLKIWVLHSWDITRRLVNSFDLQGRGIYTVGERQKSWNPLTNTSQFMLEDDMSFLDEPGEYFLDDSSKILYYMPLEGQDIKHATAVVPTVEQSVIIRGTDDGPVSHVTIRDLSLLYTRHTMSWKGDEPQQAAAGQDAAITVDCARDITLENLEIAHTGNNGVWMRRAVMDSRIQGCWMHDLGIGGVKLGELAIPSDEQKLLTRDIEVDNNILSGGGEVYPTGVGVTLFQTSDNCITHNEISDFYYSGVSVGWVWGYAHSPSKRNKILYNHIHHIGWGILSDMGGVYTLGLSEGTEVSHNVIHDIYSLGYGGWGLYTDEGSTDIKMEYNLVWNCKSSGFHQHYGENNMIRNNVLVNQIRNQLEASRVEDHNSFDFTRNIIIYNKGGMYGYNWKTVDFKAYDNIYFNTQGETTFNGMSLEQWQKATGKDLTSKFQDPGLKDSYLDRKHLEFTNQELLKEIGFEMFDPSQAGVYGPSEWQKKAQMSPERIQLYNETVDYYEKNVHR